jgi:hypothetical protein
MALIPGFRFQVPWFMYDLANGILITTRMIPESIRDTKTIILTEVPVPGMNYQPVIAGGGGNRKIGFTIPLVRRDPVMGNVTVLKAFENLRNQVQSLLPIPQKQFNPGPKVLYFWGTGSIPLVYIVAAVNFTHRGDQVNSMGLPQYTDIEVELILDESDPRYKMEEQFRMASSYMGMGQQVIDVAVTGGLLGKPY